MTLGLATWILARVWRRPLRLKTVVPGALCVALLVNACGEDSGGVSGNEGGDAGAAGAPGGEGGVGGEALAGGSAEGGNAEQGGESGAAGESAGPGGAPVAGGGEGGEALAGGSGEGGSAGQGGEHESAGASEGGEPGVAATGALDVTIEGPSGLAPDIEVTGPDGFLQKLAGPATVEALMPGTYTIAVRPSRRPRSIVDEIYVAPGGQVPVVADETSMFVVQYALRPGSGRLWLAVYGGTRGVSFSSAQLGLGGTDVEPASSVGLGAGNLPYGAAFDGDGDYWLGTQSGMLLEMAAADLPTNGTPSPATVIDTGTTDINGMAFDADGNLWVTGADSLRMFSPEGLAESGTPTPTVTLGSNPAAELMYPQALAFDGDGNLWVAAFTAIYRYRSDQLETSGSPGPSVVIRDNGEGSINTVRGLAFDSEGALWACNWTNSSLVKFTPQQLALSGTPDPALTIGGLAVNPLRLAFDNAGNLWFTANFGPGITGGGFFGEIEAADLMMSGLAAISVEFFEAGSFDSGGTLSFAPPPANVPIAP